MAESLAEWLQGIKLAEYTQLFLSQNITTVAHVAALGDEQLVRLAASPSSLPRTPHATLSLRLPLASTS